MKVREATEGHGGRGHAKKHSDHPASASERSRYVNSTLCDHREYATFIMTGRANSFAAHEGKGSSVRVGGSAGIPSPCCSRASHLGSPAHGRCSGDRLQRRHKGPMKACMPSSSSFWSRNFMKSTSRRRIPGSDHRSARQTGVQEECHAAKSGQGDRGYQFEEGDSMDPVKHQL